MASVRARPRARFRATGRRDHRPLPKPYAASTTRNDKVWRSRGSEIRHRHDHCAPPPPLSGRHRLGGAPPSTALAGQQQRLVSDRRGIVKSGIDLHRFAEAAAVTAGHDVHRDAGRDQMRGERERAGVCRSRRDQIADAHHRNRRAVGKGKSLPQAARSSAAAPTGSSSSDSPGGRAQKAGALRIMLAPTGRCREIRTGATGRARGRAAPRPHQNPRPAAATRAAAAARSARSPLIGEQRRYRLRERGSAAHGFGGALGCQRSRHCGAVAHIRAVQHGAAEPGRLERVVTAFGGPTLHGQRAADEGNPSERENSPSSPIVRKIDLRVASDRIAMSASRDTQPLLLQHARRLRRRAPGGGSDDRQQAGICAASSRCTHAAMFRRQRACWQPSTREPISPRRCDSWSGRTAMRERQFEITDGGHGGRQ